MQKVFEKILAEFDKRIGTQLKIMSGLGDETYRHGYGKSLEAYQQGKMIVEQAANEFNNGWIPCSEKMPENEKEVEITYTREHYRTGETLYLTARAFHEDGTLLTADSDCCWYDVDNWEYDEESDSYFIPEGWFESVSFAEEMGVIDMPVIAWRYPTDPYRP